MPIQFPPDGHSVPAGLAIGYRGAVMALTDVTRSPYCMVNLGGSISGIGNVGSGDGGQENRAKSRRRSYHVHWYKYPSPTGSTLSPMGRLQGGDRYWLISVRAGPDVGPAVR